MDCKNCGVPTGDQIFCCEICTKEWMEINKELVKMILRDYKQEVRHIIKCMGHGDDQSEDDVEEALKELGLEE